MRFFSAGWRTVTTILIMFFPLIAFAQLPNPGPASWGELGLGILNFFLNLVIPAAVVVIIWSGILFMTATGNETRVTKAKSTFTWAIIGLTVALIGKGLVILIIDVLGG